MLQCDLHALLLRAVQRAISQYPLELTEKNMLPPPARTTIATIVALDGATEQRLPPRGLTGPEQRMGVVLDALCAELGLDAERAYDLRLALYSGIGVAGDWGEVLPETEVGPAK